jgi:putative ABC transport system ATP-binding protein
MIHLKNVNFSYKSDTPVLNIPFFSLKRGETLFLFGPSGSGKSTLLNLIAGVLEPQPGSEIEIGGTQLHKISKSKRDQFRGDHLGFVFQMFNLVPYLTVEENILLPASFSKVKEQKLKSKTSSNIEGEVDRLLSSLGLEPSLFRKRKATELSVGQQQRVAVARALVGSPDLIIADEPTSALDTDTRDGFLSLLIRESKKQNSTVLFVSHDKGLAKHFDRVVDLREINQVDVGRTMKRGELL